MSNQDWYDVTEGDSLLQGDILRNCPVFAVSASLSWPLEAAADIDIVAKVFDLVVMTQSCDRENDKVEDILTLLFVCADAFWAARRALTDPADRHGPVVAKSAILRTCATTLHQSA